MKSYKERARLHRIELGRGTAGVVIFGLDGEVCGWSKDMPPPGHYVPGCLALDESGKFWSAQNGNKWQGAGRWCQAVGVGQ